VKIKERSGRKQ